MKLQGKKNYKQRMPAVILAAFLVILTSLLVLAGCSFGQRVFPGLYSGGAVGELPAENQDAQALLENNAKTQAEGQTNPQADLPGAGAATTEPAPDQSSAPPAATSGQLSNTKYGWGLKQNDKHLQPEMPDEIKGRLSRYGAYWIGDPAEKVIYLTFDNGYENGCTPIILDSLKANNVKATFFVTGHYISDQPELIKRMVDEGHIIGNHTDNHPSMPDISDEQIVKELQVVEQAYEKITGKKGMVYMRPPQGEYSERTLAITKELGYYNIFWSLAMVDWVPMPGGEEEAYQTVMDNLHNGAVILLHAVSNDCTGAMDKILQDAKAQGYTFKALDDLVKS